ncbi:MAG: DUF2249 domain-containing protein [Streptosporangiaceae bacterium]
MATFDARPVSAGGEPLRGIMAAVAAPGKDEELVMLAPFRPAPLAGVLNSGFCYYATDPGDGGWQVTLRRGS